MESWEGPHDEWGDSFLVEEAKRRQVVTHKHWCGVCHYYWYHDAEGCPYVRHDGPELFGVQVWKPTDWPCPQHAGVPEPAD